MQQMASATRKTVYVKICPTAGLASLNLGELWEHRELIAILAWRDISSRYKQTFLGAAWAIIQPLLM
ncbi:MAG: ABC transporter permease, partial [Candidatus Saccharimonadales bacterium]